MEKIEVIELLENSFGSKWEALEGRKNEKIYSLILEEFLIDEIVNSINRKLIHSENYSYSLRYQKYVLRYLSSEFALILFLTSNRGENINRKTVIESQKYLKSNSKCKIHPCTKLFG